MLQLIIGISLIGLAYVVGFWTGYANRKLVEKLERLNRNGKLTLRKAIQVILK